MIRCYFLIIILITANISAQSSKRQKELENQSKLLKKEIKIINELLFSNQKKEKSTLDIVEDLSVKLTVRSELIRVNNQQANELTIKININERTITTQRNELKTLKDQYAEHINNSYQSKSLNNRLMFLFSSESFFQAYKRLEYLKQYSSFRRIQGLEIKRRSKLLQDLNKSLLNQRSKMKTLITENKKVKELLIQERKSKENLMNFLKNQKGILSTQINSKQNKAKEINKKIELLIKEAILASNKSKSNKGVFILTPEAKLIADNFKSNKGRLPWPLENGVVIQKFGKQPHPVVKTTMIQSNGVSIATSPKSKVRAVFKGEVMAILVFKGSNPSVLIRHGNFITAYKNLGRVDVKKGDTVEAKDQIGEVFTNKKSGKSVIQFSIFNNTTPENPKNWIYQM